MIPHRMLSNEISVSGLKGRVTACRKRLRVNRLTHPAQPLNDADELFPETAPSVSEFHGDTTDFSAARSVMARMSYSTAYEDNALKGSGTLLLTEEQEVGIT